MFLLDAHQLTEVHRFGERSDHRDHPMVRCQFQARPHTGLPDPLDPRTERFEHRLDLSAGRLRSRRQDGQLALLSRVGAPRHRRIEQRYPVVGGTCTIRFASDAPTLLICSQIVSWGHSSSNGSTTDSTMSAVGSIVITN